jgi:hypothetical protein
MDNVTYLYKISPQEEIFCQHYIISIDAIYSAYHAGMYSNIKDDIEYENLTSKQRSTLSKAGTRCLDKNHVKERISEIARKEAEKNNICTLEEILNYLTVCIRKSKSNIRDAENNKLKSININLMKMAINAVDILIKRYPDFNLGEKDEKKVFKRGV